jgi:hypothetical protein
MVLRPDYIREESGKLVPHNNENGASQWGAYTGNRSTLSLAGYQWCTFQPSVYNGGTESSPSYTGASMSVRHFYYKASWNGNGKVAGALNKVVNENNTPFGTYGYQNGVLVDKITKVPTFLSVDRAVSEGVAYTKSTFTAKIGETMVSVSNGDGKTPTDGSSNLQNAFYTLEDCTNPFEAMFGLPGAVFTIRVYNRTLTEAEHLQNKFADIMTYFDVDPDEYYALAEEVRPTVHRMVAELGFDTDKKTVKATIAAAKDAYEQEEAEKEPRASKEKSCSLPLETAPRISTTSITCKRAWSSSWTASFP